MCLCVPGKIIEVTGYTATVDFWGVRKQIVISTVDEPVIAGDFVLTHVGFAIRRIPKHEIADTLAFYDALFEKSDDIMSCEVSDEIAAGVAEDT